MKLEEIYQLLSDQIFYLLLCCFLWIGAYLFWLRRFRLSSTEAVALTDTHEFSLLPMFAVTSAVAISTLALSLVPLTIIAQYILDIDDGASSSIEFFSWLHLDLILSLWSLAFWSTQILLYCALPLAFFFCESPASIGGIASFFHYEQLFEALLVEALLLCMLAAALFLLSSLFLPASSSQASATSLSDLFRLSHHLTAFIGQLLVLRSLAKGFSIFLERLRQNFASLPFILQRSRLGRRIRMEQKEKRKKEHLNKAERLMQRNLDSIALRTKSLLLEEHEMTRHISNKTSRGQVIESDDTLSKSLLDSSPILSFVYFFSFFLVNLLWSLVNIGAAFYLLESSFFQLLGTDMLESNPLLDTLMIVYLIIIILSGYSSSNDLRQRATPPHQLLLHSFLLLLLSSAVPAAAASLGLAKIELRGEFATRLAFFNTTHWLWIYNAAFFYLFASALPIPWRRIASNLVDKLKRIIVLVRRRKSKRKEKIN